MTQLSATVYVQLAIGFTGSYERPVRSMRDRSGQQLEPDEEGCVEDVEAVSLTWEYKRTFYESENRGPLTPVHVVKRHDLLAGCDLKSPDMIRFLSNLTEAFRDDAVDTLLEEAP